MKKLIELVPRSFWLVLALLLPVGAWAQVEPNVYRASTPSQVLATDTAVRTATGSVFRHGTALLTCTTACYFNIAKTPMVSVTTGAFLPANVPTLWQVRQSDRVQVILSTSTGLMIIQELTK